MESMFKNLIPVCGKLTSWRGTGRPNLSHKTKFSGPNGDKEKICFLFHWSREGLAAKPRSIHALLNVVT